MVQVGRVESEHEKLWGKDREMLRHHLHVKTGSSPGSAIR
jgi:hypothetical protein